MLKIVNMFLALSFVTQLVTIIGMVIFKNHALGEIHEYNGFLFNVLVLAHITLNFGWIKTNILKWK